MKKHWYLAMLLSAALLTVGCQAQPQEEPVKQPVEEPAPEVVVEEEVEVGRLRDYIQYDSENVVGVSISHFSFGPSVVETETVLPETEASAFADKLGYFTTVVEFDKDKLGQGTDYTRYSLTMNDGTVTSFCEDDGSFFLSDSADPIMGKDGDKEYLCSFYEPYEPEMPPNCQVIRYDYIDGVRTPRTLDSYLNLRADEVTSFTQEQYYANDSGNGYSLQVLQLDGDDAKAAAQAMADTVMWTVDSMYEQMGLAKSCRYTLSYADGSELSFCEDGSIFFSDSEMPHYDEEGVEPLCVLPRGTDFDFPVPDDASILCGLPTAAQ